MDKRRNSGATVAQQWRNWGVPDKDWIPDHIQPFLFTSVLHSPFAVAVRVGKSSQSSGSSTGFPYHVLDKEVKEGTYVLASQ